MYMRMFSLDKTDTLCDSLKFLIRGKEMVDGDDVNESVDVLSDMVSCFSGSDSAYEASSPLLAPPYNLAAGTTPFFDICSSTNAAQPVCVLACFYSIVLRLVGVRFPVGEEKAG